MYFYIVVFIMSERTPFLMDRIRVMAHHVRFLKLYWEVSPESHGFERWLYSNIYGVAFFEQLSLWAKGLEPDQTIIEILKDQAPNGAVNVDSLCEQGCPYYVDCRQDQNGSLIRMLFEKPFYLSVMIATSLSLTSYESRVKRRGFEVGCEYILSDLLARI